MEDAHFSDQLTLEQGAIIFFNEGKLGNGHSYYLYIAIGGTHVKEYFRLLNASQPPALTDLEKLGTILAFGEGTPPAKLKHRLHKQYGVYHP